VHYENHAPFAQVTELEREIDVSHWGNVYFEERYSLRHAGARIAGEWSRFDLMTRPAEFARTAIPGLAASLPPSARALYYRDAIGNISSSGGLCSLGCWLAECGGKCF
jgi:oligosaccharyltransferase complex subunit alpha (ribophorin I)